MFQGNDPCGDIHGRKGIRFNIITSANINEVFNKCFVNISDVFKH